MPIYTVKGPDGQTYDINGPEGATQEQVIQQAQRLMAENAPGAKRSALGNLGLGLLQGAKTAAYGVARIPAKILDATTDSTFDESLKGQIAEGQQQFERDTKGSSIAPIAAVAGEILPMIAMGGLPGLAVKGAGAAIGSARAVKAGEILAAQGMTGNLAQRVGSGAVAGAATAPVLEMGKGGDPTLEAALGGAALGGAVPAALAGVGRLVQGRKALKAPEPQPQTAAQAAANPAEQVAGATPNKTAGQAADETLGGAGLGAAPENLTAQQRLADFQKLGVQEPMSPMLTRDATDWHSMRELGKSSDYMRGITAKYDEIDAAIARNLQGVAPVRPSASDNGKRIADAFQGVDKQLEGEARAMYAVTREHPDMRLGVDLDSVRRKALDHKYEWSEATPYKTALNWIDQNVPQLANGRRGAMRVEQVEEFRKVMNAQFDPSNPLKARAVKDIIFSIDDSVFNVSKDEVFRAAREAHQIRKATTSDQGVIEDLLSMTSRTDRKVPFEKVVQRVMRDEQSLKQAKNTLLVHGQDEAWKAVKGEVMNRLFNKAFPDGAGGAIRAASLRNELQSIGRDRLKILFEPHELEQIERISRVAQYARSEVKDSAVNHSNTSQSLLNALMRMGGGQGAMGVMAAPLQWAAQGLAGARQSAQQNALYEGLMKNGTRSASAAKQSADAAKQASRDALAKALQRIPSSAAVPIAGAFDR